MVGLSLLHAAREAGLTVTAVGDKLVIRGPKQADAVARRLLTSKSDVMAALLRAKPAMRSGLLGEIVEHSKDFVPAWEDCPEVLDPCPKCASLARWWNLLGDSRCLNCEPPNAAWKLLTRVMAIREQGAK